MILLLCGTCSYNVLKKHSSYNSVYALLVSKSIKSSPSISDCFKFLKSYIGGNCLWSPTKIIVLPYKIGINKSRKLDLLTSSIITTSIPCVLTSRSPRLYLDSSSKSFSLNLSLLVHVIPKTLALSYNCFV